MGGVRLRALRLLPPGAAGGAAGGAGAAVGGGLGLVRDASGVIELQADPGRYREI